MTEKIQYVARVLPDLRIISGVLFALTLVFLGLYGMFLNKTVMNIVARKDIEQKMSDMDTSLSSYEFDYISKSKVTLSDAITKYGYVEDNKPTFVKHEGASRFTFND